MGDGKEETMRKNRQDSGIWKIQSSRDRKEITARVCGQGKGVTKKCRRILRGDGTVLYIVIHN